MSADPLPLSLQAAAARLVRRGVLLPMDPIEEQREIHAASCRYLRANLMCGTCFELNERAERLAHRQVTP